MPGNRVEKAASTGRDEREGLPRSEEGLPGMRVMFWTWIGLIATGLVFYTVIGLTHN